MIGTFIPLIGGLAEVLETETVNGIERPTRLMHDSRGEIVATSWRADGTITGFASTVPSASYMAELADAQQNLSDARATAEADRQAAEDTAREDWAKRVGLLDAQGNPIRGGP